MDDFSELRFLEAPDPEAQAMAEARMRALRRRQPAALALALTPEPGARALGSGMLAEEMAAGRRLGELGVHRAEEAATRQRLAQGWAQLKQGRWQPVVKADPTTGEMITVMVDTHTGEVRQLQGARQPGMLPSHVPSTGLRGLPPMKLSETQLKTAGAAGGVAQAMRSALQVGFPKAGLAGIPQAIGQYASRRGMPALASPEAEQTYAAWYNVIRPLVNIRTGQQMAVQELEREFAALAPRPGEAASTQLMKVHQMVPLMRYYTVGLPPALARELNEEYDQVEQMLPRSPAELESMHAQGGGGMESPAEGVLGGRRVFKR